MINLEGPRAARTNEDARAGIPMTADNVRWYIDQMERETKSVAARRSLAKSALTMGNISPEGRDVYREYLALLDQGI